MSESIDETPVEPLSLPCKSMLWTIAVVLVIFNVAALANNTSNETVLAASGVGMLFLIIGGGLVDRAILGRGDAIGPRCGYGTMGLIFLALGAVLIGVSASTAQLL